MSAASEPVREDVVGLRVGDPRNPPRLAALDRFHSSGGVGTQPGFQYIMSVKDTDPEEPPGSLASQDFPAPTGPMTAILLTRPDYSGVMNPRRDGSGLALKLPPTCRVAMQDLTRVARRSSPSEMFRLVG
jgi:hypothetical protein